MSLAFQPSSAAQRPALKDAMRHLVGAVSMITAGRGEARTGATVTTPHSLSIDPETMPISINRSSSNWPAIRDTGAFCVNLLAADQQAIADRRRARRAEGRGTL